MKIMILKEKKVYILCIYEYFHFTFFFFLNANLCHLKDFYVKIIFHPTLLRNKKYFAIRNIFNTFDLVIKTTKHRNWQALQHRNWTLNLLLNSLSYILFNQTNFLLKLKKKRKILSKNFFVVSSNFSAVLTEVSVQINLYQWKP